MRDGRCVDALGCFIDFVRDVALGLTSLVTLRVDGSGSTAGAITELVSILLVSFRCSTCRVRGEPFGDDTLGVLPRRPAVHDFVAPECGVSSSCGAVLTASGRFSGCA